MMEKHKVVLSEQVNSFRDGLSKKEQKKFDNTMNEISKDPLKGAGHVSGGLMDVLSILEEMGGIDMLTMKITKEQKKDFHVRAEKVFGSDWKKQLKNVANELKD